ncbi:MAG: 4Fe-4S binding protein [Dehalococcoidales bacterium]|nr:4Fe-4S binding protein [Dehalococcoidales bacterium]
MEWDKEATAAVERAPFFVRRLVRKKVEEHVTSAGGKRVTLADVEAARRNFLGGGTAPTVRPAPRPVEPVAPRPASKGDGDFPLSEEELRTIERLTDEQAGVETRFYSVRSCGGAVGCPLALTDVSTLAEDLARQLADSGLADYLQSVIRGPVLTHHKFRVAVAGCPNNCCEPQIKDFAAVAHARPGIGKEVCSECGRCVDTCREDAITLDGEPVFDRERCLDCGRCANACPTECIVSGQQGYEIMVGGKLGRRAQLATRLVEMVDEDYVRRALAASLDLYLAEARGPERFGTILNRTGLAKLRQRLGE